MEKEFDVNNPTTQDFLEMATYVAMAEKKNIELMNELKQSKAYLLATIQQRNSCEAKYQNLLAQKSIQTIDTKATIVTNVALTNPEQWAVPEGRVITTPKENKI
jgi:hypothetical protein